MKAPVESRRRYCNETGWPLAAPPVSARVRLPTTRLRDAVVVDAGQRRERQGHGATRGVTALDGADATESPTLLCAETVNVYAVP